MYGEKKTKMRTLMMSEREYNLLNSLAKRDHRSVSEYIRYKAVYEPLERMNNER